MVDPEKLLAWEKLCEPQDGDFENFRSDYQVRRINALRDSFLEAIEILKKPKNEDPMCVLFYDRKNKRQVSSHELMPTKVVKVYMTADSDEYSSGPWLGQEKHPLYYTEEVLGTLAYKSGDCPDQNWNMFCSVKDLVFLDIKS
jgi:hypothetical protein